MESNDDRRRAGEEMLCALERAGASEDAGAELRALALAGAPALAAAWLCSDAVEMADRVAAHLGGVELLSPGMLEARARRALDLTMLTKSLAELFDALAELAAGPGADESGARVRARALDGLLSTLPETAQSTARSLIESREVERASAAGSEGSGSRAL